VATVLHKLVHEDPIFPVGLEKRGLSGEKWKVIFGRALAKDPERRQRTASELVSSLVELFPGGWLGNLLPDEIRELRTRREMRERIDTFTIQPPAVDPPAPDG
jgi:hypothetical protein